MTREEFEKLKTGDIVSHARDNYVCYVVMENYGTRVTAVRTVDMTNPSEWILQRTVTFKRPQ